MKKITVLTIISLFFWNGVVQADWSSSIQTLRKYDRVADKVGTVVTPRGHYGVGLPNHSVGFHVTDAPTYKVGKDGVVSIAAPANISAGNVASNAALQQRHLDILRTQQAATPVINSLRQRGELPKEYVTKTQAKNAGWIKGAVEKSLPNRKIGGDQFQNRDQFLPDADGRVWYEADIHIPTSTSKNKEADINNKRPTERLLYSNDGLIYLSPDHYMSAPVYIGKYKN